MGRRVLVDVGLGEQDDGGQHNRPEGVDERDESVLSVGDGLGRKGVQSQGGVEEDLEGVPQGQTKDDEA